MHDANYAHLVARRPALNNECTRSGCYRTTRLIDTESKSFHEQNLNASSVDQQPNADPPPPRDVDWHCCCNEDLCNHAVANSTHRLLVGLILVFLTLLKIY